MNQFYVQNYEGDATRQIQGAIDACFLAGGGEVLVPEGRYVIKGIRLRSGVTLHLLKNARLVGSTCPEDYFGYLEDEIEPISEEMREMITPTGKKGVTLNKKGSAAPFSRWNNAMIRAIYAKDIAIIGDEGSEINGQDCYDAEGEEGYRGPHAINLWFCENIRLSGYTIKDSANWAHAIQNSSKIDVRNITVLGGHDGFDVRTCDDVTLEDCTFRTGDDCIAGFDNHCVRIRNCLFDSACSMLRFGGNDVLVENCRGVAPSTYGHRYTLTAEEQKNRVPTTAQNSRHNCLTAFLYYCDNRAEIRRTPGNITIRNCHFTNPDMILGHPFGHFWCCNRALNDITFENCVIEGVAQPSELICPEDEPMSVTFKNCTLSAREGYEEIPFVTGTNVKSVALEETTLKNYKDPKILCEMTKK